MVSWLSAPTLETVLAIVVSVGGFWCIFACLCQAIRRAKKSKNTAMYRDSFRCSSARGGAATRDQELALTALYHEAALLSEMEEPLRAGPTLPAWAATSGMNRYLRQHRNLPRNPPPGRSSQGGRITFPTEVVIVPSSVDRAVQREEAARCLLAGRSQRTARQPGPEMDEKPPPYDVATESFPASPPAYTDLFPSGS